MTAEEWRPVGGMETAYEVSSLGRIRSLARSGVSRAGRRYSVQERVLRGSYGANGYISVQLFANGGRKAAYLHRLVVTAFHGPPPSSDHEVCHNDGNPLNNAASNLRWGTRPDNVQDALAHGTHWLARQTHCKRGHEFTPENTYRHPKGGRTCRACTNMHSVAYRARKQATA